MYFIASVCIVNDCEAWYNRLYHIALIVANTSNHLSYFFKLGIGFGKLFIGLDLGDSQ